MYFMSKYNFVEAPSTLNNFKKDDRSKDILYKTSSASIYVSTSGG